MGAGVLMGAGCGLSSAALRYQRRDGDDAGGVGVGVFGGRRDRRTSVAGGGWWWRARLRFEMEEGRRSEKGEKRR